MVLEYGKTSRRKRKAVKIMAACLAIALFGLLAVILVTPEKTLWRIVGRMVPMSIAKKLL